MFLKIKENEKNETYFATGYIPFGEYSSARPMYHVP
jgi:hypothetical protein